MNYMKVHATYSNQIEHCNLWLVSVLSIQIHFRSLTSAETMLGTLENCSLSLIMYRDRLKGVQISLSNSQAGPGRKLKQEQEEISRNHAQAF